MRKGLYAWFRHVLRVPALMSPSISAIAHELKKASCAFGAMHPLRAIAKAIFNAVPPSLDGALPSTGDEFGVGQSLFRLCSSIASRFGFQLYAFIRRENSSFTEQPTRQR
jgi:hypothetical protein